MSALVGFMVDMTAIALMSSLETAHHPMSVQAEEGRVRSKVFLLSPSPHIYLFLRAEFMNIRFIRDIREI